MVLCLAGCSKAPPYSNNRPGTPFSPAAELIPKCEIAVRFNEDEASVPESDYLDGMFCLGLMEGILGTNATLPPGIERFCPPPAGIKTWIAAKAVVEYAKEHADMLQDLTEPEFSLVALAAKYPCHEH